jgi:hypothetical protein
VLQTSNSRIVQNEEVLLISDSDLVLLQSFTGRGHIALSAYLRLDTPKLRDAAYDDFVRATQTCLDRCNLQAEYREAIKEDMEIVGLYLKTNGHRRHAGVAIFSCAAELFWRVYPLPVPLPPQVSVGPRFNLGPLMQAITDSATGS